MFDRDVRKSDGSVRGRTYLPSAARRLSVYRTDDCSPEELWTIYARHVEPQRPDSVGTARLQAARVYSMRLGFEPDGIPHPRHANVVGWPEDANQVKALAAELAVASEFLKRP